MPKRKTYEEVKSYIESFEGYVLLSTVYEGNKKKLKLICPKGHLYDVNLNNFMTGHMCGECSNIKKSENYRTPIEEVKIILKQEGYELLSVDIKNNKMKVESMCPIGHVFFMSLHSFKSGSRCPVCWNEYRKHDSPLKLEYSHIKSMVEMDGFKLISETYKNSISKLKIECPNKHIFLISWKSFLQGCRCKYCICGENHPSWNKDLTIEERANRRIYSDYYIWLKAVYKRDSYTCQCCGDDKGGNLNVHHLDGYGWCKERRTDLTNGITLCESCHCLDVDSFHRIYGKGNNTEAQFWEWVENKIYKHIEDNKLVSSFLCAENKEEIINVSV